MADTRLRFRIGMFTVLVLGALATLLYLFGLFPNVFRKPLGNRFLVNFSDAPNVTVNTPVRRSGVKIGSVEKVDLDDESGRFLVAMNIDPRYNLRRNEEPTLTTGLLSGDTSIDLMPKDLKPGEVEDRAVVPPGSTLDGRLAANVTRFLDRATAVVPPAQEALGRISQSLERLDKIMPQFERAMEEYRLLARDVRREINQSAPDLRATNTALQRLITDVNKLMPEVQKIVKGVSDTVPDVQRIAKQTADTIPDLRKLIKDTDAVMPEAQKLLADLRTALPDVRKLVKDVNGLVPDAQKTFQGVNETIPLVKDSLGEAKVTLKNWGVVGERVSVLIQTNEKLINDIVKNADRAVSSIADTFSTENRNNLTSLLRNFSEGSKRFPGITDETELLLRQGRATLKRLDEGFEQLFRMTSPENRPAGGGILKNLDEAMQKFNRTMSDVQDIVRIASRSDGTLRRFIADPSLYNHADDAAMMLTRVIPRLDRVLKDMEVFADKLARHPESIGLGGVVRPSSGIKDPPRSVNYPHR